MLTFKEENKQVYGELFMLKKRIIFTLLHTEKGFALSRNFRLQQVGTRQWLADHYEFDHISVAIDELILLNAAREKEHNQQFLTDLKSISQNCFMPISAGGHVESVQDAYQLLRHGADKIVMNSAILTNPQLIAALIKEFGRQCLVAAVDVTQWMNEHSHENESQVHINRGRNLTKTTLAQWYGIATSLEVGEIYLNSIDQDGTGQGYDFSLLDHIPNDSSTPLILAGGAGNAQHLAQGLRHPKVDAVATAHLFNFIGDGLQDARSQLLEMGFDIPNWSTELLQELRGCLQEKIE